MKLDSIKYSSILFKYSKKDIESLVFIDNKYDDKLVYDVAILFGGVSMLPNRADMAISLYKQKKIKNIIVSGGIGFLSIDRTHKESHKLKGYLTINGILENNIIIEDKSRNTYENVINSINIIKSRYEIDKINILLITSDFHLNRCLRLTMNILNKEKVYGVGIKDGKNDIANWTKQIESKKNIYVEALLLAYYVKHHKLYMGEIK